MKIYLLIVSIYKTKIKIIFKNKKKCIIIVLIKKEFKSINYYKIIKKIYFKNNFNYPIILYIHHCKNKILHCFKHILKKNHNSLLEFKINEIF